MDLMPIDEVKPEVILDIYGSAKRLGNPRFK
jgi:hypothetical protein